MLLNKRKFTQMSRFKKLQQAQFQNEQVKLLKAAEDKQQKQSVLEQKQSELDQTAEHFNRHLQGDNVSPVVMANANAVIAREEAFLQDAKQAVQAATDSMNGALTSYLDTKTNLNWLETQRSFYQTELKSEVEKIETEQLVQLHVNRGGK